MGNKLFTILFFTIVIPFWGVAQPSNMDTFIHQGTNREYIFYAPENLPENAPLVIVLHGFTSSAENIMKYSEMNKLADENHFAVVYPQGSRDSNSKTFWNVGYDFHKDSKIDDVEFIVQLIKYLQNKYSLSAKNTFVTGMSNGGDMSYLLACTHPEVFAAVAPVAGTMMQSYFEKYSKENPVPVFAVAGTNDPITNFNGDMQNKDGWGAYQSIPFIIEYWANAIGYTTLQTDTLPDTDKTHNSIVIRTAYQNTQNRKEVLFYKVVNGGHDWPGAWGNSDFNTTQEIWRFFEKYIQ